MLRRLLFSGLWLALVSLSASAQTADELVEKSIRARGGAERLKAVRTLRLSGNVTTQGLEIPFTLYKKRPNLLLIESVFEGQTVSQGYDGQTAWIINPFMGISQAQSVSEEQAKSFRYQADFDGPLLDRADKGYAVELVGKEQLDGQDVYHLELTGADGRKVQLYLDAERFLEVQQSERVSTPQGEVEVVTRMTDYQPFEGVQIARRITALVDGSPFQEVRILTVEADPELDDARFKMPAKE